MENPKCEGEALREYLSPHFGFPVMDKRFMMLGFFVLILLLDLITLQVIENYI